jgi:hypothetical protein
MSDIFPTLDGSRRSGGHYLFNAADIVAPIAQMRVGQMAGDAHDWVKPPEHLRSTAIS